MSSTALDTSILRLRDQRLSCRIIAEQLSIPEHRVWRCLQTHGRTHEFRAEQRNHRERSPRYQPVIYALKTEALIRKYGELRVDEAPFGGYIASFGDDPGTVKDTIGEAINDAAEAAEIAREGDLE